MGMNEWLAQAYGTAGVAPEDLEKTAQAELLQQLAAQQQAPGGLDLNQFSTEELQQLSALLAEQQAGAGQSVQQAQPQVPGQQPGGQVVYPPQGQQAGQVPGQQTQQPGVQPGQGQQPQNPEQQLMKEAAEKFQEADFLGRTMAHAYVNELQKIAAAVQEQEQVQEKQAAMEGLKNMLAKHKEKSEKSGKTSSSAATGPTEASHKTEKTAADAALEQLVGERAEQLAANWLIQNGYAKTE